MEGETCRPEARCETKALISLAPSSEGCLRSKKRMYCLIQRR